MSWPNGWRWQQLLELRGAIHEVEAPHLGVAWEGNRRWVPTILSSFDSVFIPPRRTANVYRALEFLTSQGLVARIESRNAYVPSTHPERHQDCLFFICSTRSAVEELEDQRLENLISKNAAQIGFHVTARD